MNAENWWFLYHSDFYVKWNLSVIFSNFVGPPLFPFLWIFAIFQVCKFSRNQNSRPLKSQCGSFSNTPYLLSKFIPGCDLVGFHTDDYCLNFVDCCQRILGCQLQRQKMLVQHHGRVIQVKALPIGIPYSQFESFSLTAPTVYGENNSQKVCRKKKISVANFWLIFKIWSRKQH